MARASGCALFLALWGLSSAGGAGCGSPKVPTAECQDDGACGDVPRRVCKSGRCVAREGFCDEQSPCPGGVPCTENKCGPAAVAAAPAAPVECDDEHACKGRGERCQNGHCVGPDPGGPGCRDFGSPTFDFDSPELSESMKQTLTRLAKCLSGGSLAGRRVLLTGHCDPRGENEYNMGLGATRSEAAKAFLVTLGVPEPQVTTSSRGKLDAIGSEESTWKQDRRVDIEVR
ncbi:hypothetical protein BH11MYX4_BH11MYX4_28340 [soil metagenome]